MTKELWLAIDITAKNDVGRMITSKIEVPEEYDWFELVHLGFDLEHWVDHQQRVNPMNRTMGEIDQVYIIGVYRTRQEALHAMDAYFEDGKPEEIMVKQSEKAN
jgi:hypothetical protein